MTAGLYLMRDAALGVRAGLERALRDAIRTGQLPAGARLPSSRVLAGDLAISRNTIADVYTQLAAEGYLVSSRGLGTRVAGHPEWPTRPARSAPASPDPVEGQVAHDLRPGRPDLGLFPQTAWLAAMRRALSSAPHEALGYGDPRGPLCARTALAGYLARVRGVVADPQRIVLCSGYRQGVALVAGALCGLGRTTVAVERPGLPEAGDMLSRAGLATIGLAVDDEGARVELLDHHGADCVVLTPAHQFPTGVPLSPRRRTALVDWAHRTNGTVLEDDYDGEFRYDRQPIGAVQGLAPDHVVYAGTASKTLAPGLRLGWLVVPQALFDPVVEEKRMADRHSSTVDHLTLAELITSGTFDRHIRRARLHYRRRRDELVATLAPHSPALSGGGIRAGLHALMPLPSSDAEADAVDRLARAGVAVNGLARYAPTDGSAGLVIGYGTPPQHAWRPALAALSGAVGPMT